MAQQAVIPRPEPKPRSPRGTSRTAGKGKTVRIFSFGAESLFEMELPPGWVPFAGDGYNVLAYRDN